MCMEDRPRASDVLRLIGKVDIIDNVYTFYRSVRSDTQYVALNEFAVLAV